MSKEPSTKPDRGRMRRPRRDDAPAALPEAERRHDAQSAITEAMRRADPWQWMRLRLGQAQRPQDLAVLDRCLSWVRSWTAVKVGGMTEEERARQKQLGRPRDGRCDPYPGRPRAALEPARAATLGHPPADNEAHFRWIMLVHSGLYELKLSYTALQRFAGLGESTMRALLHGEDWGSQDTRATLTWHLLVRMLLAWGLEDTATFVESGGDWRPDGIAEPVWHAEDGRIQVHPTREVGPVPLETRYLRVVLVLPAPDGSPGHRREVTLEWPPGRPPAT